MASSLVESGYVSSAMGALGRNSPAVFHETLFAGGAAVENICLHKTAAKQTDAEIEKYHLVRQQSACNAHKAQQAQNKQDFLAKSVIHQPSTTRL